MIEAQLNHFDKIVSIELDEKLYLAAKNKFKKFPKVEIINGDSGKVMPKVIASLKERAIFWLDGHFSSGVTAKGEKDCPIYEELNAILDSKIKNHIFLIDDARLFVGKNDYPTLNELKNYFSINAPDYHLKVENDVIICTN
jgi:hypothetical protein